MKKFMSLLMGVAVFGIQAIAKPPNKYNLVLAPGTLTENPAVLLWHKQYNTNSFAYEIFLNG